MKRFKTFYYVSIKFLDHSVNHDLNMDPITCEASGLLIGECPRAYYIVHWLAGGQIDDNTVSSTILKKTIVKITWLREAGVFDVSKNKKARKQK